MASEVAVLLGAGGETSDVLPTVLETLRADLGSIEVSLWLRRTLPRSDGAATDADGWALVREWLAGEPALNREVVRSALGTGSQGRGRRRVTTFPLVANGETLGVLATVGGRSATTAGRSLSRLAAQLLATHLATAQRMAALDRALESHARRFDEQQMLTARIIDSLPVGLYVVDREYRVCAWNRKRETGMQGVARRQAIGRSIFDLLHRRPRAVLKEELDEIFESGRTRQFQTDAAESRDGRTYRITKIPMRLDDRTVTHVLTIGEDMTEWHEAQARIAQAQKLAAVGQLAAGVMHEINNPLATIAACAESVALSLAEHPDPGSAGEPLRIIQDEVRRCKRIIDGLLDFSRPKSAARTPLDINVVLEKTLFLLTNHPRFRHVVVHRHLDPELSANVEANEEQLIQVFMALLLNARDATEGGGGITVRSRGGREASEAVIAEVIDQGEGIARSQLGKIFEPFYTTKPPGHGTGLGLSICYGIVAEHGGRVEVESTPGTGSTFRVVLPGADADRSSSGQDRP